MNITEVSRGISHIEDLPVRDFVEVISNISDYQITEKVDGAQILFGIDEHGFYTSRETKGGKRIYNEEDYGMTFSSTYMRSTHKLLEHVLPILKGAGLKSGDQVEAEVLYGQLPNVVPYSADRNYLIFLRTTEGTVNIDRLQQKLDGQSVSISLVAPNTDNGRTIELREESNEWEFSRVPILPSLSSKVSLSLYVSEVRRFLKIKDPILQKDYRTILETPLNKIPEWVEPGTWKEVKEQLKEKKEYIEGKLYQVHIMPIKEALLSLFVRDTASAYGPPITEGGWIEGVVLKNITNGKTVKIVDKATFGTIRESAWEKRNRLTESAKSVDNASSFMGGLLLSLARATSHPELGTMQAKKYLRAMGSTKEERINTLTETMSFEHVREFWVSVLEQKIIDLETDLAKYEKETPLVEGMPGNILDRAVKKRTLESYAQTFERISMLGNKARQAKNSRDLIIALVGKQLEEI